MSTVESAMRSLQQCHFLRTECGIVRLRQSLPRYLRQPWLPRRLPSRVQKWLRLQTRLHLQKQQFARWLREQGRVSRLWPKFLPKWYTKAMIIKRLVRWNPAYRLTVWRQWRGEKVRRLRFSLQSADTRLRDDMSRTRVRLHRRLSAQQPEQVRPRSRVQSDWRLFRHALHSRNYMHQRPMRS